MKFSYPIMFGPDDGTSGSAGGGTAGSDTVSTSNPFEGSTPDTGTGNSDSMPALPTRVGDGERAPETLQQKVEPAKPPVPPPAGLTPEQISELAAQTALRVQSQQKLTPTTAAAKPPPAPLSDAEFNQRFGVVTVDAKTYTDIFGFAPEKPEQVQALHNFGQGLVKQTMRMAQFLHQQELAKVRSELTGQVAPILQTHQATVEREMRNEFYTVNPDLKEFEALVDEIVDKLQTEAKVKGPLFQGTPAEQKAAAFNFVATRARTLLGRSAPSGQAAPQQVTSQQQQQVQQPTRRMSTMSMGGQSSGAGVAAVNSRSSNDAKSIFG